MNPVLIPPFFGVDLHTRHHHAEMYVVAERHTRGSTHADLLLFRNRVAHFHDDLAHVPVKALERVAVIQDDAISIQAKAVCINHFA